MQWLFNWFRMIRLRKELRSIWNGRQFRSAKSDNFEEEYFKRLLEPETTLDKDKRNAGE
jgi:hypothetical protein